MRYLHACLKGLAGRVRCREAPVFMWDECMQVAKSEGPVRHVESEDKEEQPVEVSKPVDLDEAGTGLNGDLVDAGRQGATN